MITISCNVKTNLSNTFMSNDDDYEFHEWFSDILYEGYGQFFFDVESPDLEGINNIKVGINEIFDYDHEMNLSIEVDTELTEDEIAEYDALFDFLNSFAVPQFIDGFNSVCTVTVPMNSREKFDGIKFDGQDFYTQCYQLGDEYKTERVISVPFQLYSDFEVEF